jgi:high-affinity nickel-transport protein
MSGVIGLLTTVGWGTLLLFVVPYHYQLGNGEAFGVGLGVTAYTLGLRHAFDADHIAAIDNVTRKLMADRQRPMTVGFWFSLGHSTIVFVLCLLLSVGVRALAGQVASDSSPLHKTAGLISTVVSGVFLLLLGLINLFVLRNIVGIFRRMRRGRHSEAELEDHLNNRGVMNRLLKKVTTTVSKPWQMYPVGLLFGLGFDTATEVSLLVLAGGAAAFSLPWYAILVLPLLFAAGMSLFDSIDGCFMNFAYGWAFAHPVRKVYYNITITGLSVAVAVIIGGIELIGVIADKLAITSGPLAWVGNLDLEYVGFAIVGLFALTWTISLIVWRVGRIGEKWALD